MKKSGIITRPALFGRALAAVAMLCSTQVLADVGRTPGGFNVSNTGAATYSIPLWMPPGPNGLTPSLGLGYDSQDDNGTLGVGWTLKGVSVIQRCNLTRAQDGQAAGVTLTSADTFCLNGNKLRLVSGTYGAASSTYRTEVDDFSVITAVGTSGAGPTSFVVEGNDARSYEYGATPDSRLVLSGSTVHTWRLNKVTDRAGNTYILSYVANAQDILATVSWTPTSAGASTYLYTATFNYSSSKTPYDSIFGSIAGSPFVNNLRLENIEIASTATGSSQVVRKYLLTYNTGPVTLRSRLSQVRECADAAGTQCLSPTNITYQAGELPNTSFTAALSSSAQASLQMADYDFNGDQRDDLFYVNGSTWYVAFATAGGFGTTANTGIPAAAKLFVERFTSTGQDGILVNSSGTWWYYGWNGSAFTSVSTGIPVGTYIRDLAADTNGDGLVELVSQTGSQVYIRLNTTVAGASAPSFSATPTLAMTFTSGDNYLTTRANYFGARRHDYDGDGRQDLFAGTTSITPGGVVLTFVSQVFGRGSLLESGPLIVGGTDVGVVSSIRFNDDPCGDLLVGSVVYIASCQNTAGTTLNVPATVVTAMDWDGDGRTDFLVNNGGTLGVYRSLGNALSSLETTAIPYAAGYHFPLDQDGDGMDDLVRVGASSPYAVSFLTHGASGGASGFIANKPDLATSFVDGYGISHTPSYVGGANVSYVTRSPNPTQLPLQETSTLPPVVGQLVSSDGAGGTYTRTYTYVGARTDLDRVSDVGFEQITVTDSRGNLKTRVTYAQVFPYAGRVTKEETLRSDNMVIGETSNLYNKHSYGSGGTSRVMPYLQQSIVKRYDPASGNLISTATTDNQFDSASGGLTNSTTQVIEASTANGASPGAIYTSSIQNTIFSANGCFGRPFETQRSSSHSLVTGASVTQRTTTMWNATYCRPDQVITEPLDAKWKVTTGLQYDSFGNVNRILETPNAGQAARETLLNWGTRGQFLHILTNAKSQQTVFAWNSSLGVRTSMTTPNGAVTLWVPDVFGRQLQETRPDGTRTVLNRAACDAGNSYCGAPSDVRFSAELRFFNSDNYAVPALSEIRYFDGLERVRIADTPSLSGLTRVVTSYDSRGRMASRTLPYFYGAGFVATTQYSYDLIGRPLSEQRPASQTDPSLIGTGWAYNGLTKVATDALGKSTTFVTDVLGQSVKSVDHAGTVTAYQYDAFGNLRKTIAALGIPSLTSEIDITYSQHGLKLTSSDPDMGAWTYDYYPLGELKSQQNAKGQTVTFQYDELSRMTSRVELEGTTTLVYDNAAVNGEGMLTSLSSTASGGYSEAYAYDDAGRLSTRQLAMLGTNYEYAYAYGVNGQLQTLTYPTTTGTRLALQYSYNNGDLSEVRQPGSTIFWQANTANARGQVTQATFGNGVVRNNVIDEVTGLVSHIRSGPGPGNYSLQNESYLFNDVGSLIQRQNGNPSLTESFQYDDLHRLTSSQLGGVTNLSVTYDQLGNVTSRNDIAGGAAWVYHATKKHAVTQAGSNTYSYDANGNAITRNGYELKWTSYDKPYEINGAGKKLTFTYGPDRQRYHQQYDNGGIPETTLYIGGLLEKVTVGGVTDWRHYIAVNGQKVALVSRKSVGGESVSYLLQDHLGSVAKILNASGPTYEYVSESFEAFGARRDANNWSDDCNCTDLEKMRSVTRMGFTGHEMVGGVSMGLIHMNGRVQDSVIGRFLSADPYVQAPLSGQSLNRYSYVWNNPLSYTDPTGYVRCSQTSIQEGQRTTYGNLICDVESYPFELPDIPVPTVSFTNSSGPGDNEDSSQRGVSKCWSGEEGDWTDFAGGLLRQIGNDLALLSAKLRSSQDPLNPLNGLMEVLAADTFGSNDTNKGIFGADLAPAAEILGTGGISGVARYASLRSGTQGAREFLGLVGNRSVQMDHVFIQRGAGGNNYWNLFPTSAELNRLMGQANNWTLSDAAILEGALARFIQNGKLGATAGGSLAAGDAIGKAIVASHGC